MFESNALPITTPGRFSTVWWTLQYDIARMIHWFARPRTAGLQPSVLTNRWLLLLIFLSSIVIPIRRTFFCLVMNRNLETLHQQTIPGQQSELVWKIYEPSASVSRPYILHTHTKFRWWFVQVPLGCHLFQFAVHTSNCHDVQYPEFGQHFALSGPLLVPKQLRFGLPSRITPPTMIFTFDFGRCSDCRLPRNYQLQSSVCMA